MTKKKSNINYARLSLLVFIFFIAAVLGTGTGFVFGVVNNMPEGVAGIETISSSIVYDREGNKISELHGGENRIPVDLDDVPEEVQKAFLAAEDHRFTQHFGVDAYAVGRAFLANIRQGWGAEGASTITMQLARNALLETREKAVQRKIQEAVLALKLERSYTKEEILEYYLNQVYFGGQNFGIQTAADYYFDKDVNELEVEEAALLAGIIQRPAAYNPFKNPELAENRRNQVLQRMGNYDYIDEETVSSATEKPLGLTEVEDRKMDEYDYFVDHIIDEAGEMLEQEGIESGEIFKSGFRIHTTMDEKLQGNLEEIYANEDFFPSGPGEKPVQSAAVFLDPETGEILGLMGGREHSVRRGLNRAVDMKRPPSSTIKPIGVYGPALEEGYTPASVIDDVPTLFSDTPRPYVPSNYDNRWRGLVSMRTALRDSINIPAVRMLDEIGVDKGHSFLQEMNLPIGADELNLSLAVGSMDHGFSPLNLASAYGVFANEGILMEPHAVRKITDSEGNVVVEKNVQGKIIMQEENAYLMTSMLQTVVRSGTGTNANPGRPAAGKTGTSQLPPTPEFHGIIGTSDAWFVGYTPEVVGSVWMGYDRTTPEQYLPSVYGGNQPAGIWRTVVQRYLQDKPITGFDSPGNIVRAVVDEKSGKAPSELTPEDYISEEIFAQGNIPTETSEAWVEKEICAESEKRPDSYCPEITTDVFLKRPSEYDPPPGYEEVYPEDWDLMYPEEKCALTDHEMEIEENDIEENDTEENDMEENDTEENDIEENDTEENDEKDDIKNNDDDGIRQESNDYNDNDNEENAEESSDEEKINNNSSKEE